MRRRTALRKRLRRVALWGAAAVLAVHAGVVAFMWLATPEPGPVALPAAGLAGPRRVWVVGWGYHAAVVIEQPPGWQLGPEGNEEARYVEYGWGDRDFYMESDYWPHSLFATLFLPTESVVYVRGHEDPPETWQAAEEVFVRELDAPRYRALLQALEGDLARRADGSRPAAFPPVEGYGGRFYPGREYYIWWSNCNSWTVEQLAAAGVEASSAFVVFEGQVGGRLDGFTRVTPPGR